MWTETDRDVIDLEHLCTITAQILEQKVLCRQDPDQDKADEALEESAEYELVLISSAQDLVVSIANVLGPLFSQFSQVFATFLPLIGKYYVSSHYPASYVWSLIIS